MIKLIKAISITVMIIAVTVSVVFADSLNVSEWAKDEISKASETGMFPDSIFEGDLTRPITRAEFAELGVYFLAWEYNMEIDNFSDEYIIKLNYDAFTDTYDLFVLRANACEIVSGYDDGTFRPDAYITRQEAAKMLANTAKIFGNEISLGLSGYYEDDIADWAADEVNTMYEWNVMGGVGGGLFDPLGHYTVEQSIVTFMRLYENAPVSRMHSNVENFMTFEKSLRKVLEADMFHVDEKFDMENYTVVYGAVTGVPHGSYSMLWIVYKNGERKEIVNYISQKIPYGWQYSYDMHDIEVNEEDCTLAFTCNYANQDHYYIFDLESGTLTELETNTP